MARIEILDPTGVIPEAKGLKTATLDTLHGKKIGFRVDWANYDIFCDEADKQLRANFELRDVVHYHPKTRTSATQKEGTEEMKKFASEVDAVVVGLAA